MPWTKMHNVIYVRKVISVAIGILSSDSHQVLYVIKVSCEDMAYDLL